MKILDRYTNTILRIDKEIEVNAHTKLRAYRTEEGEETYTLSVSMQTPPLFKEKSFLSKRRFKEFLTLLMLNEFSDTRAFHELVVGSCPELHSLLSDSTSLSSIDREQMKEMLKRDHPDLVSRVNKYSIASMYDAVIEVIRNTFQKYSGQTDYRSQTRSRITLRANSQEAAELRFEHGSFQYFERSWGGPDEIIDFTTNTQVRDFLTRRSYLGIIDGRLVGIVAQALSYILEREFGVQTIREYLEQKSDMQ